MDIPSENIFSSGTDGKDSMIIKTVENAFTFNSAYSGK